MIAKADFDNRESLVRLLERRAGEDAIRLCRIESEDAVAEADLDVEETDSGEYGIESTEDAVAAEDASVVSDSYDTDDVAAPEKCEWSPPCLSDVSDHEDDGKEVASSPQYDPEAHYPWVDCVRCADGGPDETPADKAKEIELPSDPIERLEVLVSAAKCGDESAIVHIRRCLDEHPEIWQRVGDLAGHAESLLIEIIAEGNQMVVESLEREVQRLKAELAGGEPSPLERLAIQRIVAAWLHAQYVDRATLTADAAGSRAAAWAKRQEAAEKRFQAAVKSLDIVRRLRPKAMPLAASGAPRTDPDIPKSRAATKTVKRPELVASRSRPACDVSVNSSDRFAPANRLKHIAPAEKELIA